MKPDIIQKYTMQAIKGYVGVFCECGNTLYVKNIPEKAGNLISITCPCGFTIQTIYHKED